MNTAVFTSQRRPGTAPAEVDPLLLWPTLFLLLFGLVMVYSASIAMAEGSKFTGHQPEYFLLRHAIFLAVGLVCGVVAFQVPMRFWQELAPWLFLFGVALLVVVLIPHVGRSVNDLRLQIKLYGKESSDRDLTAGIKHLDIV